MSALGVRRATLLGSLYVEQGLLVAFGIVVGVVGGLVGAVLALPSVPEFADVPPAPPQLYGIHPAPVLGTVIAAALVLGLVIAVSSVTLLRGSRYEQLREAPT
jgi:putative ABC transport system permease protein